MTELLSKLNRLLEIWVTLPESGTSPAPGRIYVGHTDTDNYSMDSPTRSFGELLKILKLPVTSRFNSFSIFSNLIPRLAGLIVLASW